MKNISNTSAEILGISPDELTGYTEKEIREMIEKVQAGVQGDRMNQADIIDAAQKIYEDANQ